MKNPDKYFDFHRYRMTYLTAAAPNRAHLKLTEMEQAGKLKAIITQNIDNLHQKSGSEHVLELHGSAFRNFCVNCRKAHAVDCVLVSHNVPRCECGGIVRPDIVMFGEALKSDTITKAIEYISNADVLIVGGTSLVVYPAAGLIEHYRGNKLVLINQSTTTLDEKADLLIDGRIGEVLSKI